MSSETFLFFGRRVPDSGFVVASSIALPCKNSASLKRGGTGHRPEAFALCKYNQITSILYLFAIRLFDVVIGENNSDARQKPGIAYWYLFGSFSNSLRRKPILHRWNPMYIRRRTMPESGCPLCREPLRIHTGRAESSLRSYYRCGRY